MEFLVLRFEVEVVYGAGQLFGSFEFPFHESFVDDLIETDHADGTRTL